MVDLGAGEKEVLALGMQVPDAVVILDERLGRFYAESLKLTFTGSCSAQKWKVAFPGSSPCSNNSIG